VLVVGGANFFPIRYEDLVVQDNFRFGDDKEIVSLALSWGFFTNLIAAFSFFFSQIVALQNDVLTLNKKSLKRPTRTSLAPQTRSRSGIVNSPF